MKRIMKLMLACALVLGTVSAASATDFKVKGEYIFGFNFFANGSFTNDPSEDDFSAVQRLRMQLDIISSESLKGQFFIEVGETMWGNRDTGGNVKTDATNIEVRRAFIDWILPETSLKLRIGLQGVALPSAVAGSPVFDHDAAGITSAWTFNDMFSLSFGWLRVADGHDSVNDTYSAGTGLGSDDADLFFLALPIKADGFEVTPWAAYGFIGDNADVNVDAAAARFYGNSVDSAYWAGISFKMNLFDPLTVKADAIYGATSADESDDETSGYYLALAVDYKLEMFTPGIFAWYMSGDRMKDKGKVMPIIAATNLGFTSMGFDGGKLLSNDELTGAAGFATWGVGLQLADISFIDKLSHTLRVAYYQGTNHSEFSADSVADVRYMTTGDGAYEVNFDTQYQVYDNLTTIVELGYISLTSHDDRSDRDDAFDKDAFRVSVGLKYTF